MTVETTSLRRWEVGHPALMRQVSRLLFALLSTSWSLCHGVEIHVASSVVAVRRDGITGAGFAVSSPDGKRVTLHYPNHPDDFGGSSGTGTAVSDDGGATWKPGADNWPIANSVDLWQERLRDGSYAALGIRWLPDPQKRGELTAADVPPTPWGIAFSQNGRDWTTAEARLSISDANVVIARPLPHLLEADDGTWLMPAYAWSKTGNRTLLLRSDDRGRHWRDFVTISGTAAILKSGAPVTTPWLETMVARTQDGTWLAIMRTGSSDESSLVASRSADGGASWSPPEKVVAGPSREAVVGKLPNLLLLPSGMLALTTAHSKRGCFLYLSTDGTGREWSAGHVVTTVSGGNTSMVALDAGRLLVFTPANGVINCRRVTLEPERSNIEMCIGDRSPRGRCRPPAVMQ